MAFRLEERLFADAPDLDLSLHGGQPFTTSVLYYNPPSPPPSSACFGCLLPWSSAKARDNAPASEQKSGGG
jgi:hypothetical protein